MFWENVGDYQAIPSYQSMGIIEQHLSNLSSSGIYFSPITQENLFSAEKNQCLLNSSEFINRWRKDLLSIKGESKHILKLTIQSILLGWYRPM